MRKYRLYNESKVTKLVESNDIEIIRYYARIQEQAGQGYVVVETFETEIEVDLNKILESERSYFLYVRQGGLSGVVENVFGPYDYDEAFSRGHAIREGWEPTTKFEVLRGAEVLAKGIKLWGKIKELVEQDAQRGNLQSQKEGAEC